MDLFCLHIPGTDYNFCIGVYHVGVWAVIAVIAVVLKILRMHPTENAIVTSRSPLICRGQYGGQKHEPVERVREGLGYRCPLCGHTVLDA